MCRQEMCSQVVRFAKIRKLWNESKQLTLVTGAWETLAKYVAKHVKIMYNKYV